MAQTQLQRTTQTEMMIARQAQEVQVAMLSAKKFPRNETDLPATNASRASNIHLSARRPARVWAVNQAG